MPCMILKLLELRSFSSRPDSNKALRQTKSKSIVLLGLACVFLRFCALAGDADHCSICGKVFGLTVYTSMDHVTHEKVFLCYACATCPDECYICGLPAVVNPVKLP